MKDLPNDELARRLPEQADDLYGRAGILRERVNGWEQDKINDILDRTTRTLRKMWEIRDELAERGVIRNETVRPD